MEQLPEYISAKDVAAIVGCTPKTIHKHTRLNLIPASAVMRFGTRTKYHRIKIMKHLTGGKV